MLKDLIANLQKLDEQLSGGNQLAAIDLSLIKAIVCGLQMLVGLICQYLPDSVGIVKKILCVINNILEIACNAIPLEGIES